MAKRHRTNRTTRRTIVTNTIFNRFLTQLLLIVGSGGSSRLIKRLIILHSHRSNKYECKNQHSPTQRSHFTINLRFILVQHIVDKDDLG